MYPWEAVLEIQSIKEKDFCSAAFSTIALCGPLSIVRHSAAPIGASNQSLTNTFCSDTLYGSTDFGSLPSFAEECSYGNLSFILLRKTTPRPILGIANDFAGSTVQFNLRLAGARCSLRSGCCRSRQPPDLPFNMHRHRTAVCKRSAFRPEQAFCYRSLEPAFRIQGVVSLPRSSAIGAAVSVAHY